MLIAASRDIGWFELAIKLDLIASVFEIAQKVR
jgi:hypothetical protein